MNPGGHMARAISISLLIALLFAVNANAQINEGACCVGFECIETLPEDDCRDIGGVWYSGEDCDAGFVCPIDFPCGSYVVGDYNGSGEFNIADIIEAFQWFIWPRYPELLCKCPPGSGNAWHVRMDLNNSCTFNIADIITGYSKLKTGSPELVPCDQCPPY